VTEGEGEVGRNITYSATVTARGGQARHRSD
jgi:hypothetical protein